MTWCFVRTTPENLHCVRVLQSSARSHQRDDAEPAPIPTRQTRRARVGGPPSPSRAFPRSRVPPSPRELQRKHSSITATVKPGASVWALTCGCKDPAPPTSTVSRIPRGPARRSIICFPPPPDAMYYFDREGWPIYLKGVVRDVRARRAADGASLPPGAARQALPRSLHW